MKCDRRYFTSSKIVELKKFGMDFPRFSFVLFQGSLRICMKRKQTNLQTSKRKFEMLRPNKNTFNANKNIFAGTLAVGWKVT